MDRIEDTDAVMKSEEDGAETEPPDVTDYPGIEAHDTDQASVLERHLSASEEATLKSSGRWKAPWWLKWMECPFAVTAPSTGKKVDEATAWAMDSSGRAPVNQAGVFVGAALLRLATADAGCERPATCENTVYGLHPSSMLTLTSAITGVAAALLMPVFGAIVDHTCHRKLVGILSALVATVITVVQINISEPDWLIILVLEAVGRFSLLIHATAVFAYLPDLTRDESDLTHYTSRFYIRQFCVQTMYVGILVVRSGQ